MKGWVVAFALLAGCQPAVAAGKVEVVSLDCDTANTFGVITLTVRNTGPALGFTKAFVSVDGRLMNGVASEAAPGALVTYNFATGNARAVGSCELVAVQDYSGRSLL